MDRYFKDIEVGTYFIYDKELYLKIANVKTCNAVRLVGGVPVKVGDNLVVTVSAMKIVPLEGLNENEGNTM